MPVISEDIVKAVSQLESKSAEDTLKWALETFKGRIALSSSFQCEESALIHMLHQIAGRNFRVFTLDTGRLNEETYEVMERMREKYGIAIEAQFPERDAVEKLEREKGLFSFRESVPNRKECCHIRKVVPLDRMLATLDAWITGLRQAQSVTRDQVKKFELDAPRKGILKINPLIDWSTERVWEYIKSNKIPYNRLYDAGYASIGCAPCTRAIKPGEDMRAGRWWWENPEHKECGLHLPRKP